jgi:hypothetical protein
MNNLKNTLVIMFLLGVIFFSFSKTLNYKDVAGTYYKQDTSDKYTKDEQWLYLNEDKTFYLKKTSYDSGQEKFKMNETVGEYNVFDDNIFLFIDKQFMNEDNYLKITKFIRCKFRENKIFILKVQPNGQLKYFETPFERQTENTENTDQ